MNRPLSRKHTVQPFSVPTEQKTTVLPTQSQRKLWEAVLSLKLESCSVMGATKEGLLPPGGGPLVPFSPSLQLFLPLISSSESKCLRLKAGWCPLEKAWIQTRTSRPQNIPDTTLVTHFHILIQGGETWEMEIDKSIHSIICDVTLRGVITEDVHRDDNLQDLEAAVEMNKLNCWSKKKKTYANKI